MMHRISAFHHELQPNEIIFISFKTSYIQNAFIHGIQ